MSSQRCNNFPIHQSTSAHATLSLSAIPLPAPAHLTLVFLSGEESLGWTKGLIELRHHLMFISAQMKLSCTLNKPLAQTYGQQPHDKLHYDITPSYVLSVSDRPCVSPKKTLKLICSPPSQIYCCSRFLPEIDFTPYFCK